MVAHLILFLFSLATFLSAPIGELLHFTLKIFVLVRVSFGLSLR